MKKNISFFIIALCGFIVYSCSEETMDEINKNVNNPTEMGSKFIITDVMTSTAFNVVGNDLAYYASIYIEHNVGVYNQMYNAEIRTGGPAVSSTYNNSWENLYSNLYSLKIIREKCSAGGDEEGNYYTLGIAQVLTAYNLAVLTDMFGDVPWTEGAQPGIVFTPQLDKQADIYKDIFILLDDAIDNLNRESIFGYLGKQDLIYGGDVASIASWKKLAYGLKARYTMHLSFRDAKYDDVLQFADSSFASADEQCQFNFNGSTSNSPFYMFFTDRDYFGVSQSFYNKLDERADPRIDVLFEEYPETGEFIIAPNGNPDQTQGKYAISAISTATAPIYLLSYHELEFLKAEAYARKSDLTNATASLKKAVVAAMGKVNIGIADSAANAYFDDEIAPGLNAGTVLGEIMMQKYIAFYEEEAVEAYNDYRRLKAMGNDFITLENPLNSTRFPLRYTYGSSDVTTNFNVADATGDGTYVYSENVWWAGGSR